MFDNLKKYLQSTESLISLVLGVAVVAVVGTVIVNAIRNKPTQTENTSEETKSEETVNTPISSPTSYTVVSGDTLWSISEKHYKTGYNWIDLAKANNVANADYVQAGQVLSIPVVTPIVPEGQIGSGITDKKPEQKMYTVKAGDTLWSIAVAQYGNGYRWTDIAKANNLTSPDLIFPGNVFNLP